MEQKTLIARALKGDSDSFALAVRHIQDRSYRIAYSYLHNEAASMDAVCDAVEQAFNRAPMSSYYTFTKKNSPTLEGSMNRHLQFYIWTLDPNTNKYMD
ncbi:hypothetical protein [Brevibacillus laterosporus]|uniref:Uncharacterized protein n=1 Tax=Brevibacillus laterosporus TaxID=1465 RepID=A0AAP3DF39_BRELA|nr:hypothetical protein [Brevibacillus laterosporus]MCR8979913.1 hypothetical protein [Brevibacillus laterosporus]MCZ0807068.1 hypothetical protein [Brevibacillus laterosporus]MCZ0826502.1 hypothetical protein [Brevibacillus laterosporus]MCZ0850315.1 hypothetical protein [Brevibacillus laterosporus]